MLPNIKLKNSNKSDSKIIIQETYNQENKNED